MCFLLSRYAIVWARNRMVLLQVIFCYKDRTRVDTPARVLHCSPSYLNYVRGDAKLRQTSERTPSGSQMRALESGQDILVYARLVPTYNRLFGCPERVPRSIMSLRLAFTTSTVWQLAWRKFNFVNLRMPCQLLFRANLKTILGCQSWTPNSEEQKNSCWIHLLIKSFHASYPAVVDFCIPLALSPSFDIAIDLLTCRQTMSTAIWNISRILENLTRRGRPRKRRGSCVEPDENRGIKGY